jgi:redox-sensitive bicupin YhaK (pirin superfamily)
MITKRPSQERGYADHGWLKSFHSFSFADYYDPNFMGFGPLRVINEDKVTPGMGFGTHGHKNMEIISYVLEGELAHKDNMGNIKAILPNEVQRMSAGTGVMHSEFNHSIDKTTHFLQIWIQPHTLGIQPSYEQTFFDPAEKRGKLRLIASPEGSHGSVTIHADANVFAALIDQDESCSYSLDSNRAAYVHVARGSVSINGETFNAGDAAMIADEPLIALNAGKHAEILLFDLPKN